MTERKGREKTHPLPQFHTFFGLALYRQAVTITSFSLAPKIEFLYITSVTWISSLLFSKKIHLPVRQVKDRIHQYLVIGHDFPYIPFMWWVSKVFIGMLEKKLVWVLKALTCEVSTWLDNLWNNATANVQEMLKMFVVYPSWNSAVVSL